MQSAGFQQKSYREPPQQHTPKQLETWTGYRASPREHRSRSFTDLQQPVSLSSWPGYYRNGNWTGGWWSRIGKGMLVLLHVRKSHIYTGDTLRLFDQYWEAGKTSVFKRQRKTHNCFKSFVRIIFLLLFIISVKDCCHGGTLSNII